MSKPSGKAKQAKSQNFTDLLYQDTQYVLNLLTVLFMLMIIVVIPLYSKMTYASIGSSKRMLFLDFLPVYWKILLPFLLLHLILRAAGLIRNGKFTLAHLRQSLSSLHSTDYFVLAYGAAVLISYVFSGYRDTAWHGSPDWSMGTLTQLSLVGGYFLITRFWNKKIWTVWLILPVSAVLFLLGYLNRFGIWPIPMEANSNPQFISLAGNINWYCGYLVTILFGAVYAAWSGSITKRSHQILMNLYLLLGFGALVTNGSSSGILTMLGILFVLFLLSVSDVNKLTCYCEILLLLGASCLFTLAIRLLFPDAITYQEISNNLFTYTPLPLVIILLAGGLWILCRQMARRGNYPAKQIRLFAKGVTLFFALAAALFLILLIMNTIAPGSIGKLSETSVFTFSPAWGSRRGATWMAGAMAWWEQSLIRKFIGIGPDCMSQYLYNDASASITAMLESVWPNNVLSNAHCEWLTILLNLGLLGLVSFAGMIISAVTRFLKSATRNDHSLSFLTGACGLSILAYSFNNIFSFQQILNTPAMFVLLAVGISFCKEK